MTFDEMFPALPELTDAVVVLAFEGWNDAGEAATGVIDHLLEVWDADWLGELDPEEYYDFQVNRPEASFDDSGARHIVFPTTRVFLLKPPHHGRSIVVLRGIEPNNKWRSFSQEILAILRELDATLIVTLGSMLAETPHTRPIPVNATGSSPDVNARFGLEESRYEGPTGIVGVISAACAAAELPVVSYGQRFPTTSPNRRHRRARLLCSRPSRTCSMCPFPWATSPKRPMHGRRMSISSPRTTMR